MLLMEYRLYAAMNLEEGYQEESKLEEGKLDATANPYAMALKKEAKDQFMVGEYLLVAPLFTGETERRVITPKRQMVLISIPASWLVKEKLSQ